LLQRDLGSSLLSIAVILGWLGLFFVFLRVLTISIKKILEQAYPSGKNIDENLIEILYQPAKRENSKEAFRGFINLFDDYLATDLFEKVFTPIQLIWGEKDPWESLNEAREWKKKFRNIKRLDIIYGAGHCPHDEEPDKTNKLMNEFIQETK